MSDDETAPGQPPAESVPAKKATVKKTAAKKATVKKTAVKKTAAKKATVKKATVKKTAAKKVAVKKTAAKKAEPAPVEPAPVEPVSVEPAPVEPAPVEPAPVEPAPVEPAPVEPAPVEPVSVEPAPVEPVPVATPEPRRRRPILVLALVAVVVLAVVLAVRLIGGDDSSSDQTARDGGTGGAGSVPTPPASAPGRGSYVESSVAADGTVTVRQWIRSSTQIRTLEVAVVDPAQQEGSSAQAVDVVAQALDGTTLARRDSVGADPVRLQLSTGVPNLYLSYRITGGAADASQTVPGRMLVDVLGMDVDYSGSAGGVQRLVTGPGTVTNVACLRVDANADSPPKACGAPTDGGGWRVDLRGIDRTDRLVAQLDSGS